MRDQISSVTVTFTLTSSDVYGALVSHMVRRMWFLLPLPILGALGTVWAIADPQNGAVTVSNAFTMLLIGVFFFIGSPYLQTRSAMKVPNFGGPMTLTLSERGIEFTAGHSNANIAWSMVKGVSETNHAILIHIKPAGFQVVPQSQVSSEDRAALTAVLSAHLPGKTRAARA
jgi:hypothetical protein